MLRTLVLYYGFVFWQQLVLWLEWPYFVIVHVKKCLKKENLTHPASTLDNLVTNNKNNLKIILIKLHIAAMALFNSGYKNLNLCSSKKMSFCQYQEKGVHLFVSCSIFGILIPLSLILFIMAILQPNGKSKLQNPSNCENTIKITPIQSESSSSLSSESSKSRNLRNRDNKINRNS